MRAVEDGGRRGNLRQRRDRRRARRRRSRSDPPRAQRRVEREVLQLCWRKAAGHEIAERLSISSLTVRTHVKHVMEKLKATTADEAVSDRDAPLADSVGAAECAGGRAAGRMDLPVTPTTPHTVELPAHRRPSGDDRCGDARVRRRGIRIVGAAARRSRGSRCSRAGRPTSRSSTSGSRTWTGSRSRRRSPVDAGHGRCSIPGTPIHGSRARRSPRGERADHEGSPLSELVRAVRTVAAGGTYVDPLLGALALKQGARRSARATSGCSSSSRTG